MKSNRGGAREGSGRKKIEGKRQSITIRLPPDLIDRLPAKKRGEFIEEAIVEKLSRHG